MNSRNTMVHLTSLAAGLMLAASAVNAMQEYEAAEIRVVETRTPGGDSEIRVTDPQGNVTATYKINLSTHHNPATHPGDPAIKQWESRTFGAFVCFNSNQFDGREIDTSKDPNIYDPTWLDVKQWIAAFRTAGMDHAVLTARHTSGFLLWDSPTSDHDVGSSGNPTDVVKAFIEECRRQDIEPGIYYCLWGGTWNPHPNARALILAQLHELATQYGPIPYFWIDMGLWKPADLSIQEIYDSLKNVNPRTVVLFNQHIQDGTQIRYFPTDVLDGELTLPPASGHDPFREVGEVTYYLPFEMNLTSQQRAGKPSWFTYGEGKGFAPSRPYPAATLAATIRQAYARGAARVLLACAPDHTGRMRDADVEQLTELGRMLKAPGPVSLGGKATASGIWPSPRLGPELAFDGNPATR